jgi:hypothetical protein
MFFRLMLQVFHLDVAYVSMAIHTCFKSMFQVFYLFLDVCYKCFIWMLDILKWLCCKCMF